MQTIPSAQLRLPDGGAESSDNSARSRHRAPSGIDAKRDRHESVAEQIDQAQQTQRESDQKEYGLGDRSDGDYPHDEQAAGT